MNLENKNKLIKYQTSQLKKHNLISQAKVVDYLEITIIVAEVQEIHLEIKQVLLEQVYLEISGNNNSPILVNQLVAAVD